MLYSIFSFLTDNKFISWYSLKQYPDSRKEMNILYIHTYIPFLTVPAYRPWQELQQYSV